MSLFCFLLLALSRSCSLFLSLSPHLCLSLCLCLSLLCLLSLSHTNSSGRCTWPNQDPLTYTLSPYWWRYCLFCCSSVHSSQRPRCQGESDVLFFQLNLTFFFPHTVPLYCNIFLTFFFLPGIDCN